MGAGLVSDDVRNDIAAKQFGQNVSSVSYQADGESASLPAGFGQGLKSLIDAGRDAIAIAAADPFLNALWIHVNAEEARAGHGRGQGLRAAHTAHAAGDDQLPLQAAAKMLAARLGEGLVGALHNPLASDVDPGTSRHLAVHHQS